MKNKTTTSRKEVVTLATASTLASIPTPSHVTVSITLDDATLEITSLDTVINSSMAKPGVWGLYDKNGVLLDVAQTKDIASEWSALPGKLSRPKFISM